MKTNNVFRKSRDLGFGFIPALILITAALIGAGVGGYFVFVKNKGIKKPVVCIEDVKQCPDGSYVNRTGPNCEFAPCPNAPTSTDTINRIGPTSTLDTSGWQTYQNDEYGFEIKYPPSIPEPQINPGAEFLIADSFFRFVKANFSEPFYDYYVKELSKNANEPIEKWNKITKFKINGYEALQSISSIEGCSEQSILITNHETIVIFSRPGCADTPWPTTTLQIINSFKFLERAKLSSDLSPCLPSSIKLTEEAASYYITSFHSITVEQRLADLGAYCSAFGKLVDRIGREIYFYRSQTCWGNPPADFLNLIKEERDKINRLKEVYNVIEISCNSSTP